MQESFNPGETHYEENLSNTATQKARLAADSRIGLAGSQIGVTKNSSSNEKLPSFYETPALRILVVDDEPDVVASFKFSFEDAGYKVDGFTDPLIALSKFKANIYDIVLLDIRMRELDGIELYERMMRINNKVLVFFVTAYEIYKKH